MIEAFPALSELVTDELRASLRRYMAANPGPYNTGGIVCLLNAHAESLVGGLILPELPRRARIPWRYEGHTPDGWRTFRAGLDDTDPLLAAFSRCEAIYA